VDFDKRISYLVIAGTIFAVLDHEHDQGGKTEIKEPQLLVAPPTVAYVSSSADYVSSTHQLG